MKILGIPSLEQLHFFNDIKFVFKCIRGFYKISMFDIGISLQQGNMRVQQGITRVQQGITRGVNVRLKMPRA